MAWEEPAFVEINLDAEIGSYQSDFVDPLPRRSIEVSEATPARAPTLELESAL